MQQPGKPNGPSGQICPLRNVDCGAENGCKSCYFWIQMDGVDPVSGEKISGYDCIEHWKVKIGLHQIRIAGDGFGGVQKATESFRNAMVDQNDRLLGAPRIARIEPIGNSIRPES